MIRCRGSACIHPTKTLRSVHIQSFVPRSSFLLQNPTHQDFKPSIMSFRFSVGDLIGAANLTYRLSKALRESQNAGEEYRAAIDELGCVQHLFIRVSCLKANRLISQATFQSASYLVIGSMDVIQSFLQRTRKYDLGPPPPPALVVVPQSAILSTAQASCDAPQILWKSP
jgi:hypothetical protein